MPWLDAFVADLRARGVTFALVGERLKVRPWSLLTDIERAVIGAHRPDLKRLVRAASAEGQGPAPEANAAPASAGAATVPDSSAPAPAEGPEPEPRCRFCCVSTERCKQLKESNYAAWSCLHFDDPEQVRLRDEQATRTMFLSFRMFGGRARY